MTVYRDMAESHLYICICEPEGALESTSLEALMIDNGSINLGAKVGQLLFYLLMRFKLGGNPGS